MKKKGIIILLVIIIIGLISSYLLWMMVVNDNQLSQLGLMGVFFASLLSHLTVVARDFYIPVFLTMTSYYNPLILGGTAAIGAAVGEVTCYFLGWSVSESFDSSNKIDDKIGEWIKKHGLWAVFLLALTPIPDTPLIILVGSRKLSLKKLFFLEVIGKTTLYSIGAVIGGVVFFRLRSSIGFFGASSLIVIGSMIFCIATIWKPSRDLFFNLMEKLVLNFH